MKSGLHNLDGSQNMIKKIIIEEEWNTYKKLTFFTIQPQIHGKMHPNSIYNHHKTFIRWKLHSSGVLGCWGGRDIREKPDEYFDVIVTFTKSEEEEGFEIWRIGKMDGALRERKHYKKIMK